MVEALSESKPLHLRGRGCGVAGAIHEGREGARAAVQRDPRGSLVKNGRLASVKIALCYVYCSEASLSHWFLTARVATLSVVRVP